MLRKGPRCGLTETFSIKKEFGFPINEMLEVKKECSFPIIEIVGVQGKLNME